VKLTFGLQYNINVWFGMVHQIKGIVINVSQSISFDVLTSQISVLKTFAHRLKLFQTLMPSQRHISSVSETQHQVSSGKIQQVFLLCASLTINHFRAN
jgi:hypothetical protein